MIILQQKKAILVNYEISSGNPDSSPGIYPTIDKVAQYILAADNRREN